LIAIAFSTMTTIDEGYIKYTCHWIQAPPLPPESIADLNRWRDQLYHLGLIGIYDNGIGFGNLSIRDTNPDQFIISGTQTGGLPRLTADHYTTVTAFDLDSNQLTCRGPIQASSESLTHASAYQANAAIGAIIHIHNRSLWQQLMNTVPTTDPNCAYGTPEIAREIMRLCQEDDLQMQKILVMSGHEEGIITFGRDLDEAGAVLMQYHKG
jgi:L-ribulose-5-phosphate 4-epimerase